MLHRPPSLIEGFSCGTHLLRAGLCAQALPEFQAAYAEADELGDIDIMAACLCEMAWCSYKLGRAEEALECAMGAQRLQERQGNQGELARALAVEAIVFLDLGFSDEAYELAVRAVDLAEPGDDTALLAFTLNAKGVVLAVCHEAELGITLLQRAVTLAHAQDNAAAEAYYQLNLGFCHARIAEENARVGNAGASAMRDVAIALFDRSVTLAKASGDQWTLRVALGNAAELHSIEGRLDAARQNLTAIEAISADPGTSLSIHYLYTLSDVLLRSGTPREARAAALQAMSLAEASQQIDHQVNVLGKLAEIHEALGETADALAAFKRFHASYVQQSGETARRRARIEEIRTEARQLRSEAATLSGLALTDALTGIANRRSFDMILNRLAGTAISLAIIDLDHFKSVNDDHSHLVGDAVLRRVASVIVSQVGPHGHAARLGGEEFALIFPDAPEASAAAFCEGIRFAISDTEWSDLAPGLKVTASIGLAAGDGSTLSADLMQTADSRLYIAKTNGRDRVVFSDALVILPAGKPGSRRRWRA